MFHVFFVFFAHHEIFSAILLSIYRNKDIIYFKIVTKSYFYANIYWILPKKTVTLQPKSTF